MIFPLFNDFRASSSDLPSEEKQRRYSAVLGCQEQRGVDVCSQCSYFDYCEVVKAYLRDFGGLPGVSGKGG